MTTATKTKRTVKSTRKSTPVKSKPVKASGGNTFTTVDVAKQHNINAKTLRARIRRNIDAWAPLFKDGVKHVFADNKATHAKIDALLA